MVFLYDIYQQPSLAILGFILVVLWTIVWKGLALWFAARKKQKGWFIALLVLNTLGLLPIIYLIWFRPKNAPPSNMKQVRVTGSVKRKR